MPRTDRKLAAVRKIAGHLTADEARGVLTDLLVERPELADDVRRLAEARLSAVDPATVEQDLVDDFNALLFTVIADRVGRRDGGYVHEVEAASEVLEERLKPYCDEVVRLAAAGQPDAAVEVGLGTMAGLYRLRDEATGDSLLGWVDTEQEAWELAASVIVAFDEAGLEQPTAMVDKRFPVWAGIA